MDLKSLSEVKKTMPCLLYMNLCFFYKFYIVVWIFREIKILNIAMYDCEEVPVVKLFGKMSIYGQLK